MMHTRHFGDSFRLTLITGNRDLAEAADQAGVDLIGIDLERLGKAERQTGFDSRISIHSYSKMKEIMDGISRGKSFVRLNSLNRGSEEEINSVIALGVRNVMLPFFHGPKEVEIFLSLVNKRARVILLLETAAALIRIEDILAIKGIDEVMVGLNDLRIATSVTSHFEILISPVMDLIAKLVKEAGLPLSVGGVARYEMTTLPVSPDLVLAQYPRLNATGAWISRSMVNSMRSEQEISALVKELRNRLTYWSLKSSYELEAARQELRACLRATFPQN